MYMLRGWYERLSSFRYKYDREHELSNVNIQSGLILVIHMESLSLDTPAISHSQSNTMDNITSF